MCHGGCGVLVHVEDGKVIKVKGDPQSPLNKGKMCVKGLSSIEHLYHPNRLKYPLKRKGKRGEGKWARISWDEALSVVTEKIETVRDQVKGSSLLIAHDNSNKNCITLPVSPTLRIDIQMPDII